MLREVHFHGKFEREPVTIHGSTLAEIIEGVSRQLPELQPAMGQRQVIQIEGCDTFEDLHRDLGDQLEIHIYPALIGAKSKFTQVIVGAVLIAVSFAIPPAATLFGVGMKAYVFQMGALMLVGGIAAALAPQPDDMGDDGKRSGYLGAPRNTVAIGTRIPILYGEFKCSGHYLSFDVNTSKGAISS